MRRAQNYSPFSPLVKKYLAISVIYTGINSRGGSNFVSGKGCPGPGREGPGTQERRTVLGLGSPTKLSPDSCADKLVYLGLRLAYH